MCTSVEKLCCMVLMVFCWLPQADGMSLCNRIRAWLCMHTPRPQHSSPTITDVRPKDKQDCASLFDPNAIKSFHDSARRGHMGEMEFLIEKGIPIDTQNQNGDTPLYSAAGAGLVRAVKFLLRRGALIDATDKYDWTSLHWAALKRHAKVVKLLIMHGANPNLLTNSGHTALFLYTGQSNNIFIRSINIDNDEIGDTCKQVMELEEHGKFYSGNDSRDFIATIFVGTPKKKKLSLGAQGLLFTIYCNRGAIEALEEIYCLIRDEERQGAESSIWAAIKAFDLPQRAQRTILSYESEFKNYVVEKIIEKVCIVPRYVESGWCSKARALRQYGKDTGFPVRSAREFKKLMACVGVSELARVCELQKTLVNYGNMRFYFA